MKKVTIYGLGDSLTYEELSAIELIKGAGARVELCLPEKAKEEDIYSARIVLSNFGVDVLPYLPGAFEQSEVVVSFGRSDIFQTITKHSDKPSKLVYGLEGVWPTKAEIKANASGIIDEVFVPSRGRATESVQALVKTSKRGVEFRAGYTPFCNPASDYFQAKFSKERPIESFNYMRNTPDNSGFAYDDHWRMVSQVTAPFPRSKHFTALNWGKNLTRVAGNPCLETDTWSGWLNLTVEAPPVPWDVERQVYLNSSALLHHYPEQDEPFSFAAAKAMLLGTVVVAPPTSAFLELIKHGETGFFSRNSDEAAYYTSKIAWEPFLRIKVATAAHTWFVNEGPGNPDICLPWWKGVLDG